MRFFRLTGALLGATLPFSGLRPALLLRRRHKLSKLSAVFILLAVLVLGWLFLDVLYRNLLNIGNITNHREIVFTFAVVASWLVCLFAGVNPARERFARPSEDGLWRVLPVRPLARALSGFTVVYLVLLPLHAYVFLPALFVYLRLVHPDPRWLAGAFSCVLLTPVFPAAAAAGVALFLRRFRIFSRRALIFEICGLVAVIVVLAVVQVILQNALVEGARDSRLVVPLRLAFFLTDTARALGPAHWLAAIFRPGEEAPHLLAAALFSLGTAAPVVAWAARTSSRAEERLTLSRAGKPPRLPAGAGRGILISLVLREALLLAARPRLVFEAVLRLVVLPAFLILYAVAGPRELSGFIASFLASSPALYIVAVGLLLFLLDISFLAATGVSREARTVQLSLTLPVVGTLPAKAKVIFLLCLSLPPAGLALALIYLLVPVPPETLVCAAPGLIAYLLFSIAIGLAIDFHRPVFSRSSSFFNQNANTILALAAEAMALAALGAVAGGALLLGMSPLATAFLVVQLLIAADIVLLPRLFKSAAAFQDQGLDG